MVVASNLALETEHADRRAVFLGASTGTIRPLKLPVPVFGRRTQTSLLNNQIPWLIAIHKFIQLSGYSSDASISTIAWILANADHKTTNILPILKVILEGLDGSSFIRLANKTLRYGKSNSFNRSVLKEWFRSASPKKLSRESIQHYDLADLLRLSHAKAANDIQNICFGWILRGPSALNPKQTDPTRELQPIWVHEAARTARTTEDAVRLMERFHCQIKSLRPDLQQEPTVQAMFLSTARADDLMEWINVYNIPSDPALQLILASRVSDLCQIVDPLCLLSLGADTEIGKAVDAAIQNHTTVNMRAGQRAPKTCVVLDTSSSLRLGIGNSSVSRAKAVTATALRLRGRGTLYFVGSSFRDLPNDLTAAQHLLENDWAGSIPYPSKVIDICSTHNIPFDTFVFVGDQAEHLRDDPQWNKKLKDYRNKIGLPSKAIFVSVSSTTRCLRPIGDPLTAEIKGIVGAVPRLVFDFSTSWDRFFAAPS